jgi:hypothetical protein|tara:strand:- start:7422 stop:7565 length:144 start_codon:yes stop_codon:yes gene_type:complete
MSIPIYKGATVVAPFFCEVFENEIEIEIEIENENEDEDEDEDEVLNS